MMVDGQTAIEAYLIEIDPNELHPIARKTITMTESTTGTFDSSVKISKSGIYLFKAYSGTTGSPIACMSENCMVIIRDETSSLIEAGSLYEVEAMQGQEVLLIFDFDVVTDEELTLSSESDPSHFNFTVQKMTVIEQTRIYASILVTKA